MTYSSQRLDELCKLFAALQDGELDEATVQAVEKLILEDRAARRLYVSYMGICAGLQWNFGTHGDAAAASFDPEAADRIAADAAGKAEPGAQSAQPQPAAAAPATPPVKSPVLGFLGGTIEYVNHSRRLMFLFVAVMLSGWFVFQVGSVLIGRWWAGNDQVADGGLNQPRAGESAKKPAGGLPGGSSQSHGKALAWLSGSIGSRWQIEAPNPAPPDLWEIGTEFQAARQVNFVAGLAEITFRSGATVVVSAPAQFSVTTALRTDLKVGKLSARVPHDAKGFTVDTPAGSVVDLGTEFGVEVTPDHRLDVQVFVGEVKVDAAPGAEPGNGGESGVHVTAGKTIHVEPGQPTTVVESKDKNRFQRDLTIASDSSDKAQAAYLDSMKQLKPVVWLRMEGAAGDRTIRNEAGGPDGKLYWDGPGNPFVDGRVGKGLWLRGPALKDFAILPDYPKAAHSKLSVAAWVYADSRPPFASIAKNWGAHSGQFLFMLGGQQGGHSIDLEVDLAQADGSGLVVREGENHPFPLHEWQHVAFVVDGTAVHLYRQGREVVSAPCAGLRYPNPMRSLGIGQKTNDAGDGPVPDPHYWDGKLDEIAVFNDALTPEDIKKLAAAPPR